MTLTRRTFLGTTASATMAVCSRPHATDREPPDDDAARQTVTPTPHSTSANVADRFDPWIEVDTANLHFNVASLRALAGGRDNIIAVVKNNAYGLGLVETARRLEPLTSIVGFAVVKTDAAITLRDAGIRKPVLHMGICCLGDAQELIARNVALSLYTDDAPTIIRELATRVGRPIAAHAYLDTGLGRLGMPHHRALPWLQALAQTNAVEIQGTFMCFSEDLAFDQEQLRRLVAFADTARSQALPVGALHAASSTAMFHLPAATLDLVRPGMSLYGGYPHTPDVERQRAELRAALRFRCRVVRVEQILPNETVGYGRKYVATAPTWVATLPAGHVDGVSRKAVDGARVLIGDRTYPMIGAVSASHCIVEVGPDRTVNIGDTATLLGPDHPDIWPNSIERMCGASVYDLLMHINPALPRVYT